VNTVRIKAPATIANLVCGFDVLGLCLSEPADIMEVSLLPERTVTVESAGEFPVPADPERNTAGAPLLEWLRTFPESPGFHVRIYKQFKPGSGLGSSAASAAAAVVAANHLLGSHLGPDELVRLAMHGEKVASGVKHADNVAPCIFGGVVLIRSIFPLDVVRVPAPELHVTVVHPQIEIKTADARSILRKEVKLKDAIRQWGNIGGLVAGLIQGDYELIARSMEDVVIEPVRSILIPGFDEVKKRCLEAGALGGGIAGSGPSVFMLSRNRDTALKVELAMRRVYSELGLDHTTYVATVNSAGCTIIK
jgi:homoserine kinase